MDKKDENITIVEEQDTYEDICYICRRPESKAGRMLRIPESICICVDCMQKTFDTMGTVGVSPAEFMKDDMTKMPGVSFLNIGDLGGFEAIPKKQRLKKAKTEKEKKKPEFDIKNIPAPHIIKEKLDEYVVGQEFAIKSFLLVFTITTNAFKRARVM